MASWELEIEEEDYLTLSTLSDEDLTTAANPKYRMLLTELLNEGIHGDNPQDDPLEDIDPESTMRLGADPNSHVHVRSDLGADPTTIHAKGTSALDQVRTDDQLDSEPPPAKKLKKDDDSESTTSSLFDPVIAGSEEDLYHFTPPKVVKDFLERHFHHGLTKRERKAMSKADPKPDTTVTCSPEIDGFLKVFWKGKLNLKEGEEIRSVQTALLNATGPLCGLWSQI